MVQALIGIHREVLTQTRPACRDAKALWTRVVGAAHLHDLAQVHDEDAVAEVFNDQQVMRDEQIGQAQIVLEGLQEIQAPGPARTCQAMRQAHRG